MNLQKLFEDVSQTGFDPELIKSAFTSGEIPLDWKIGEKISECFLEDYCDSVFPYNDSRDAKDSSSNLPGTDMVGFFNVDDKALFLFGEVKTSDQKTSPPSVVAGKDGLLNQLDEIKTSQKKRKELILWLGHKVEPLGPDHGHVRSWRAAFIAHYRHSEYKIFGVMIRGTGPDDKDLKGVYEKVVLNMNDAVYLELLSLYLPILKPDYAKTMGGPS